MERRADARVGLRADDDEPPNAELRQHRLQVRVLEGLAVALLDERLRIVRRELRHDPPFVAALREVLVGVLDPDDRHVFPPCLLDEPVDVRDDAVSVVRSLDDAVLDFDDEERERRHVDNLATKYDRPVAAAAEGLKRVPLFSGLNDRQRRKLARLFRERTVEPGVAILNEGKMSGVSFFVVAEGEAVVTIAGEEVAASARAIISASSR